MSFLSWKLRELYVMFLSRLRVFVLFLESKV